MVVEPGLCGDLVGNPEDQFSHNEAHMGHVMSKPVGFFACEADQ